MTLVTVIVPTYNRTRLLMDRAIPSILNQTHQDLELIVVGDGTERETEVEMAQLMATDARVRFWNLPHQEYPEDPGQRWCVIGTNALNFGLDHARGDWIAALADDDEFVHDAIASLLERAALHSAQFCYGRAVTDQGQWYGFWPPSAMNFTDGSYVYKNGMGYRYDPECYKRGLPSDADLWIRMIEGGVRFTFIDQLVMKYHVNPR